MNPEPEALKTKQWQLMYKSGEKVNVSVKEVYAKNHDLRLILPDGKTVLFKYESQNRQMQLDRWYAGQLISLQQPKKVLIQCRLV